MPDDDADAARQPTVPSTLTRLSSLSSFGLMCSAAALFFLGIGAMTISELDSDSPYFAMELSNAALYVAIGLISILAFLLIFTARPTAEHRAELTGPYRFLLFAWLCVFFTDFNLGAVVREAEDALPEVQPICATTEGIAVILLQAAGALLILAFSLSLICREWKKPPHNRAYLRLVLLVWLVNLFGSLLSALVSTFPSLAVGFEQDFSDSMHLNSLFSHAVACVVWPCLLLLSMKGMRDSIANQLARLTSTEASEV